MLPDERMVEAAARAHFAVLHHREAQVEGEVASHGWPEALTAAFAALDRDALIEAMAPALTDCPGDWGEHDEGDKDVFRRMAADGLRAVGLIA